MRLLSVFFALAAVATAVATAWIIWPPLVGVVATFILVRLALITDGSASTTPEGSS